jgi:membrane protein implicated in regulation of membrane protease activity
VLPVYIGALVLAAGVLLLQLVLGHHGGGDADAAGHDAGHDTDHDATLWTFVASIRFWSFGLLAFGLVGTLLTLFGFAGSVLAVVLAALSGLASGVVAVSVIRRLTQRAASSHATSQDVVGHVGRVLVPLDPTARGKVRVEVKGSQIDYVARAGEAIAEGEAVVVEECDGAEVTVSRAPKELK